MNNSKNFAEKMEHKIPSKQNYKTELKLFVELIITIDFIHIKYCPQSNSNDHKIEHVMRSKGSDIINLNSFIRKLII